VTKIVSASEFKAKCLQLIDQMQKDGQPVTVTKRGKVVAELKPKRDDVGSGHIFGCLKNTATIHGDLDQPIDADWEAQWDAKWDALGLPVRDDKSAA
jgi:prevent-host-death family protein